MMEEWKKRDEREEGFSQFPFQTLVPQIPCVFHTLSKPVYNLLIYGSEIWTNLFLESLLLQFSLSLVFESLLFKSRL